MNAKFYVYVHRKGDTGDIFYVGKGIGARARSTSKKRQAWRDVVAAHGWRIEYIAFFYEEADALDFEREVIKECRASGCLLVNATTGGQGTSGYRHTERARRLMAEAAVGRKPSEESKRKMSASAKNRKMSDIHRQRLSEANRRRFAMPEERAKVRDSQLGKIIPPEQRAKISASKRGVSNGKPSAEQRARMSAAQRARYAKAAPDEVVHG